MGVLAPVVRVELEGCAEGVMVSVSVVGTTIVPELEIESVDPWPSAVLICFEVELVDAGVVLWYVNAGPI